MSEPVPAQAPTKNAKPLDARTLARLHAVQCLYQMETTGQGVDAAVREYRQHRLGGELDGEAIRDADDDFFEQLVRGVVETQRRIDPFIQRRLKPGWTLKRLDAVARAALRCALYELIRLPNVPYRTIITEYVEIAASFFGDGEAEPRFVNGVLDTAAREIRSDEA